jgi:5-(carboxyamino)imidazole ribonucleotide mutase
MGSQSDWPVVQACTQVLDELGVTFEVKVTSAHRTPEETKRFVTDADERGAGVFVCAAGMAAHLAGAVAAATLKPVVGIPIDAGSLQGIDALLATVQMPGGIPVACMAIGKAGAKNAGYFSAQILSLSNAQLMATLTREREANKQKVAQQNLNVQADLKSNPSS